MITIEQQIYFNDGQSTVTHFAGIRSQFDKAQGWRIRKDGKTMFSAFPPFATQEEAAAFAGERGLK